MPVSTEIRRGTERFTEKAAGRLSRHSFSFGASHDPENLGFGPMTCHDDHLLGSGQGFETHRHSGLVIVSWVVSGVLRHTGPDGSVDVPAGSVAVLNAGPGVDHAEVAAAPQTRFVQVWLRTDDPAEQPSYDAWPVALGTGLTEVLTHEGATFSVARLEAGESLTLPEAPLRHLYLARGALTRSSLAEPLAEGDAFRFTAEPGEPPFEVTAAVPSELLLWTFA